MSDAHDPKGANSSALHAARRVWKRLPLKRTLIQVLGIGASAALLAWCASLAFKDSNRAGLKQLQDAPAHFFWMLLACSIVSLALNGAVFWITIRPVRRLALADVLAANAVASLLGYLPFKLGMLWRFAVHHKRDGLAILTIGGWLGGNAAIALGVFVPPLVAGIWRRDVDASWWCVTLAGWMGAFFGLTWGARAFSGSTGLARLRLLSRRVPIRAIGSLIRSARFRHLHAGLSMLSSRFAVGGAMGLRIADMCVQAARFVIAAHAMGIAMGAGTAIMSASAFFLLGVSSPSGAVGAREGGTTGLAALVRPEGISADAFAILTLSVSASEAVIYVAGALVGAIWLKFSKPAGESHHPVARASSP